MKLPPTKSVAVLIGATVAAFLSTTNAMVARPKPFKVIQPNGLVVTLKINGDPYDAWMSDLDGYTVLRDSTTGFFVYAEPDDIGGLRASQEEVVMKREHRYPDPVPNTVSAAAAIAGTGVYSVVNPLFAGESVNNPGKKSNKQKRLRPLVRDCSGKICGEDSDGSRATRRLRVRGALRGSLDVGGRDSHLQIPSTYRTLKATTGTLRNLVVLLRWSDHANRTLPTQSDIDILMNNDGIHTRCPTGSVRDVFLENSYGKLVLESTVIDWILMDNTEQYYSNGSRGVSTMIRDAIRYALQYLDSNGLVDFSYFDADGDGMIDSITFIHSGYGAEWGGIDVDGQFFEDRIWSHKWQLPDNGFVSKDGTTVRDYHISPGLWGTRGSGMGRIGVIAHETGHFLGLPDLYDVDGGGQGIGMYCLMANSWGFDLSQQYPPHMSALVKIALGWINPVEATVGTNQIEAAQVQEPSAPQAYIVSEGFPDGEFLLIENRQRIGFDSKMPQGGILIWHIDYTTDPSSRFIASLSNEGHPGQKGWPQNGNHYGIALVQADGFFELERGVSAGDIDDIFHGTGVDELLPCLTPGVCQQPNTDSYQSGIVTRTNVHITDISRSQSIMSFNYRVGETNSSTTSSPSSTPQSESPTTLELANDRVPDPRSSEPSENVISLQKSIVMFLSTILAILAVGIFL
jgi:M6 family metalloprotease-like protein